MNLRIALISTAHIHTRDFVNNVLKATDGRRIVQVWDEVADRGRRYAEMAGAIFEPDLQKVLRSGEVDGFVICAENTRHLPLLEQLIPVGKPIFCEKPLVTKLEDLKKVRELLRRHATPVFCGYFQPFLPEMAGVEKLLREGALGKVTRMRFRNAHQAAYGRWFDNSDVAWFTNPALAGGGAFLDMGTHAIHLARSWFGPVKEVWAQIENHSGIYPTVDDYGVAQLRFASGVVGTIEAAWTQSGGLRELEIVGSQKTLWHDGKGYCCGAFDHPSQAVEPGAAQPTRVDRLVSVLRGEIPAADLQRDLEAILDTVAIMEACYASAKSGQWERVAQG